MADIGEPGFSRTKRFDQDARLARIKNAKERSIGVDKQALDEQKSEKEATKLNETKMDQFYEGMASYFDQKLLMMEQERRQIVSEMERDLVAFRDANQQKEMAKEFDLNDPEALKKDQPARLGDEDPRNGISSLQKFEGEDLDAGMRRKLQQAQQAAWCKQQMAEKTMKAQSEVQSDAEMAALLRAQEDVQRTVATSLDLARKDQNKSVAEMNKAIAAAKSEKAAAAAAAEKAANEAEQSFMLSEPHMAEDSMLGINTIAPHRVRTDHWKGMSEQEKAEVMYLQHVQREEMAKNRAAAKADEDLYVQSQAALYKTLEMKAAEVEAAKLEQRLGVAATLKKQQEEKAARDAELANVYTNVPKPEFFAQFGTSAR